ncbi:MAG: RNA methyltransferase [Pseudomonadota bacterium]
MTEQSSRRTAGLVKEITSTANPLIKEIKGLALKKNRDAQNAFLAEGLKLVTDAVERGWHVKTLVFGKAISDQTELKTQVEQVAAKIHANGGTVLEVNAKVLSAITRRDNPQMVVAVIKRQCGSLQDVKPARSGVWIALDRVRDPGNLGTIMRTADALGADGVLLVGDCTDPFGIEAVRATMGSLFHVPIAVAREDEFIKWRPHWPGKIVGTHLAGARDHRLIDYGDKPVLLLMGNEQKGLPDTLTEICDELVRIAMDGNADSLNLAVATALTLFEARRGALPVVGDAT